MVEAYEWLTGTSQGLLVTIVGLVVLFALIALVYERKTRKLYPDRNRRGTKATAKAKAKKAAERQKEEKEDD